MMRGVIVANQISGFAQRANKLTNLDQPRPPDVNEELNQLDAQVQLVLAELASFLALAAWKRDPFMPAAAIATLESKGKTTLDAMTARVEQFEQRLASDEKRTRDLAAEANRVLDTSRTAGAAAGLKAFKDIFDKTAAQAHTPGRAVGSARPSHSVQCRWRRPYYSRSRLRREASA